MGVEREDITMEISSGGSGHNYMPCWFLAWLTDAGAAVDDDNYNYENIDDVKTNNNKTIR